VTRRIVITCGTFLVLAACNASAADHVRISLSSTRPAALVAGRVWTAKLTVRPHSFAGAVRVTATGPGKLDVRASGGHGAYRARLVFPAAGRWKLAARAGGAVSQLGSLPVRKPPAKPLLFAWPTSIDLQPDGSLLVVENGGGQVDRVQPSTGRLTVIASALAKPYSIASTPSGAIYLSNAGTLQRIDGAAPVKVADAGTDIGPIAVAPNGDVVYTTDAQAFEVSGGAPRVIASGLAAPHGIAVASDGAVLVSDRDSNRVLRVDPATGAVTTLISVTQPGGIDVAPDGSIYLIELGAKRIGRYSAAGVRLGDVGPAFNDPYGLQVAADGTVYVIETAPAGTIKRIAPNGTVSTLSAG
jgi:sugar lactone lactonase YvrE